MHPLIRFSAEEPRTSPWHAAMVQDCGMGHKCLCFPPSGNEGYIHTAAPKEQLGVRCLAQGHVSRSIEGGESAVHSVPPPTIPAGPRLELATFGLRV